MKPATMSATPRSVVGRSRLALRTFATLAASAGVAAFLFSVLKFLFGRPGTDFLVFSPAFACATLLLGLGSGTLHAAVLSIRRERQLEFKRRLLFGLVCGTGFVGVQSYGLWALFPSHRTAEAASLGVTAFIAALTALHGLHFLVALLFLGYVLNQAWTDRYDHEYHWGLTCCAWLWHFLGIVWIGILAVFSIAL